MMDLQFGKLERVDMRSLWPNEAINFTPWLAQNLQFLDEALGLELELESAEKGVGPFRADILAKDVRTGTWVLIENQFERTNHIHLGQVITYAAGLDAKTIIWAAEHFTAEHIAALNWLNSISNGCVRFFGIQIELWAINEAIAPAFRIVGGQSIANIMPPPVSHVRSKSDGTLQNIDDKVAEVLNRYPNLQQWISTDKRSASLDEIVEVTGHSRKMVANRAKDGTLAKTKNPNLYRIDSIISWLKDSPLPKRQADNSMSESSEDITDIEVDQSTNGNHNGHLESESPLDLPELEVVG